LTINADDNEFMRNFHKPQDEKRMVVILPPAHYGDWLQASASESNNFMKAWPADDLKAETSEGSPLQTASLF
jgi:putative SOS response-associated peptidase YedK